LFVRNYGQAMSRDRAGWAHRKEPMNTLRNTLRTASFVLAFACATVAVFTMANRIALDGGEAVHAQAVAPSPWTAAGSTGVVDESSVGRYSFTNASAGFLGGIASINPLELRYNVTNTYDNNSNPAAPGWTTLELGAQAPGGSVVGAFLYKVNLCTGAQTLLCSTRVNQAAAGTCTKCSFAAGSIDFNKAVYYVRATISRTTPNEIPILHTLRVY
jgi:hypothetical protein